MSGKIKIYVSDSIDPWFNLAIEDWLFLDMQDYDHVLYLWRNNNTVVIGRSQNPWVECHLEKMEEDGIKLARRQSGGGAVFHDMGNTNFTFISKKENYDKTNNIDIITRALASFGVNAYAQGRNDILVDIEGQPRKVSGSAYKEKSDRAFHHGTLLLNADLERLIDYLNPSKKKLAAKGIKSVRSRVANLSELNQKINHDSISAAIVSSFSAFYQVEVVPEKLCVGSLRARPALNRRYMLLQSWEWLYGQTLPFTHQLVHRFSWGGIDLRLDVKDATIDSVQFFSDSLYPEMIEDVEKHLRNCPYTLEGIESAFGSISMSSQHGGDMLIELQEYMLKQLR